jgi:hypothetical protein
VDDVGDINRRQRLKIPCRGKLHSLTTAAGETSNEDEFRDKEIQFLSPFLPATIKPAIHGPKEAKSDSCSITVGHRAKSDPFQCHWMEIEEERNFFLS